MTRKKGATDKAGWQKNRNKERLVSPVLQLFVCFVESLPISCVWLASCGKYYYKTTTAKMIF